jgi:hypothetical protein
MLEVGFEPTITVFERAKVVYALDQAATVICKKRHTLVKTEHENEKTQRTSPHVKSKRI